MCNVELYPLIYKYQKGNVTVFDAIYKVFENLIIHYSRHLPFEDTIQELNVFLVELLYQIPLDKFVPDESISLKKYISTSIRNKYISLSKQKQLQNSLFVEYCEDIAGYNPPFEDNLILSEVLLLLTKKQNQVIVYKYFYGYSDSEISTYLHISRQAVNRLKTRGLLELKKLLKNEQ